VLRGVLFGYGSGSRRFILCNTRLGIIGDTALSAIVDLAGGAVKLVECQSTKFCELLQERGYLTGDVLDPLEAAYQASRGKVLLRDGSGGWQAFLRILEYSNVSLKIAIVYRILRSRFPEVRPWVRRSTLLARRRGESRSLEVLVLEEGESISIGGLIEWSEAAVKDGHDPVVAIVDRNGQATFYEARSVSQIL
jgi:tRNA splicing endonuclease